MSSSLTLFFFFFVFTFLYTTSNSFNITNILNEHDDFSTFNKLLSETQLASTINSRQTITVLVVSNGAISSLSGQPTNLIKKILSLHIILDYYDQKKLKNLSKKSVLLTTLFQSSGQARGQQGFLNATVTKDGNVLFGSAVPGPDLNAELLDSVASLPFNISVLHISSAIMIDVKADNAPTGSPLSPVSSPPRPAESPNDDDYEYDEPPPPPSFAPRAAADGPSKSADSDNGVSRINSLPALAFTLLMSSIWWFMA
ncbi:PREDICTED: fasciclin-like arabinogalactan protein 14 [Camelina sativa]|uniref:Fasciclin-like arabinogalactan protein 14 n=1 Tax=Camelina sativa TaxID=90675 RepID=A0ABM0XJQ7_CAMSA|nr:PREDICTED: fasciclin-like arabinogalactan protein 14 [Camelina sativa]